MINVKEKIYRDVWFQSGEHLCEQGTGLQNSLRYHIAKKVNHEIYRQIDGQIYDKIYNNV